MVLFVWFPHHASVYTCVWELMLTGGGGGEVILRDVGGISVTFCVQAVHVLRFCSALLSTVV